MKCPLSAASNYPEGRARAALAATGALPENVNYAVKSSFLLSFLESVPEASAKLRDANTKEQKFEDVVKSAEQAAVLVGVLNGGIIHRWRRLRRNESVKSASSAEVELGESAVARSLAAKPEWPKRAKRAVELTFSPARCRSRSTCKW